MALALLVSVIAIFVTITATQRQQQLNTTRAALIAADNLRTGVSEAEAGVDDYAISNGVAGAHLYQASQALVGVNARRLIIPQGVSASFRRDIAPVQRLTPSFLTDLQRVLTLQRVRRTGEAMPLLSTGYVAQETHSQRAAIARMQMNENNLLRLQITSLEDAQRLVTTVVIITGLLDIGSFIAIVLVLRRTSMLREQFAEERARAEEQARVMALEETNRRMKDFLGVASHEIRTPLTSLKIGLQLSAREVRRVTEEARKRGDSDAVSLAAVTPLLDRALASTGQLERLAADLVDVTRIEASALSLRPAILDLDPLLEDCIKEQRLYHPGRTITLSRPDSAVIVMADGDHIRQVVTNYLVNAFKFSEEARPVAITLRANAQKAEVRVRDEGPGIPQEEQRLVWDQFYRAQGIGHRSGSSVGFGLGLYICKSIVEQHGGAVGVESAVGRGSTFWFTLPLVTAPEALPASPAGPGGMSLDVAHSPSVPADGA